MEGEAEVPPAAPSARSKGDPERFPGAPAALEADAEMKSRYRKDRADIDLLR